MKFNKFLFNILVILSFFWQNLSWAADITFTYSDFSSLNSSSGTAVTLQLNGSAANNVGASKVLRVTPAATNQAGTAWTTTTVPFQHFSTNFIFQISNTSSTPADGFTFALQSVGSASLGGLGTALAYEGLGNSVAVEFDTYTSPGYDPGANYIGIDMNGNITYTNTNKYIYESTLTGTGLQYAWVDYDNGTLSVYYSTSSTKPAAAALSYSVSLQDSIAPAGAYAGFTAGTGGSYENHDILYWTYHGWNIYRWDGSSSANWNTAGNWSDDLAPVAGNDILFNGSTNTSVNHNAAAGTSYGSLTFESGSAAFAISGNALGIADGDSIQNDSSNIQTISADVSAAGDLSLQANSGDLVLGNISGINGKTLTAYADTGRTITLSGILSGNGYALTKTGAGTLILSNANTYTGITTISAGTLRAGINNALAYSLAVDIASGAAYDLNNYSDTLSYVSGAGNIALGSGTLTVRNTSGFDDFSGAISGTGGLTKDGDGVLTLNKANTYTGATTISDGFLGVGVDNALSDSTNVSVASGGTYDLNGFSDTVSSISGAGNIWLGSGTLTVGNASDQEFSGVIRETGSLIKQGAGTLTLSGSSANTYSGATTINNGTIALNKTAGTDAIAGDVSIAGGTLRLSASNQIKDTSALTLTSGAFDLNGKTETITSLANSGGTFTTGAGHLTGTGATITWSGGINTVNADGVVEDGHIVINGGTNTVEGKGAGTTGGILQLNAGGAGLQMTGSTLTLNSDSTTGGKLLLKGNVSTNASAATATIANGLALANPGSVDLDSGTRTFTIADGAAATDMLISAAISNGSLTKVGTGLLQLSCANSYSGATTVNAGTLQAGIATNAFGTNSAVTLANAAGALLDLNNFNETIGSLAGGGTTDGNVTLGSGTLTVGGDGTSTSYSGMISGTGGLTKTGAGTLTLARDNPYTGNTTISAGTLALGSGGTTGWVAGNIIDNSALIFNHSSDRQYSGTISGTGSLEKQGAGTLTLSSANSYSGGTTITQGKITATDSSALGTGTLANNANLEIGSVNLIVGGYSQATGSDLSLSAASETSYGKITSSGNASVANGSTINVTVSGYVPNNAALSVINAGSGSTYGSTTVTSSSSRVSFTGSNVGGNYVLTATRSGGFNSATTTTNEFNVATVLDGMDDPTSDMSTVLAALENSSSSTVNLSLDTMTPTADNSIPQVGSATLGSFLGTINNHLSHLHSTEAEVTGVSTGDEPASRGVWAQSFGTFLHQDPKGSSNGYDAKIYGTAVGYDRLLNDALRVGASFGYANDSVSSKDFGNHTDVDSYQTTFYAGLSQAANYLNTAFSFAYNCYESLRNIIIPGLANRTANSSYGGQQYGLYAEAGHSFTKGKFTLTPLASLDYEHLHTNSYTERNADAMNLSVKGQGYNLFETGLGAKLNYTTETKWGTFIPELHVKWLYDVVNDSEQSTSTFTGGGGSFITSGFRPARSIANIGTKFTLVTKKNVEVSLNYDFQTKEDFYGHSGLVHVRYKF